MLQTLVKVEQETEADQLKRAFVKVMVEISQIIPETPTLEDIAIFEPSIEHLKVAPDNLIEWLDDDDLIWAFVGVARFYEGQGQYNSAERYFDNCLEAVQSRLGDNHPYVAASLNNLALLYESQGRYTEAEPLFLEALDLRKQLLVDKHPHV
ncbi:MAG: tetratricopeptide repeat protein, partial [Microcystis aeruginosa]